VFLGDLHYCYSQMGTILSDAALDRLDPDSVRSTCFDRRYDPLGHGLP